MWHNSRNIDCDQEEEEEEEEDDEEEEIISCKQQT